MNATVTATSDLHKNATVTRLKDMAVRCGFMVIATTSILVVGLIFAFMFREAVPVFFKFPLSVLLNDHWSPASFSSPSFGLYPLLWGSLIVTAMALLFAVPTGVAIAIYIAELAQPSEKAILKPFIELLAGIPSVVLGFFGMTLLAPLVQQWFGLSSGLTALTGGLLLGLMAIPTIVSVAEDAFHSVPQSYKEASYALGASHIETIFRILLPAALPGVVAAIMLGVGRVIGETMAVLMVTGNAAEIAFSPFASVRTMTATIAAEMGEVAFGTDHYNALFCVGVILLLITFAFNMLSRAILKKYRLAKG